MACRTRFVTDTRLEGEYALDRGNPQAEPTRIPGRWTNSVPTRDDELSNRVGAINQEKKCPTNRGDVKSKGLTLLAARRATEALQIQPRVRRRGRSAITRLIADANMVAGLI